MAHTYVYIICPVRNATAEQRERIDRYVEDLEASGYEVHYPPRDVNQENDDGAIRICQEHRDAMLRCDEVHVWWDRTSTGCHFDLGMAYMLSAITLAEYGRESAVRFRLANPEDVPGVVEKSFQNLLRHLCREGDPGASVRP